MEPGMEDEEWSAVGGGQLIPLEPLVGPEIMEPAFRRQGGFGRVLLEGDGDALRESVAGVPVLRQAGGVFGSDQRGLMRRLRKATAPWSPWRRKGPG
jgi:hypothetical protein